MSEGHDVMRINVGCGQTPTGGGSWRNFDGSLSVRLARVPLLPATLRALSLVSAPQYAFMRFARSAAIEYADATRRLPLGEGTVEVLYSSHMVEHLDRQDAGRFLREALRVLRPGGVIRLAVPDLARRVASYCEGGDADAFVAATRLAEPRPGTLPARVARLLLGSHHHRWMYDGASLCRLLERNGFVEAAIVPPGETRIPDPGALDLAERAEESVYVEATKKERAGG
jgi:SAM-dependent methyltransferase